MLRSHTECYPVSAATGAIVIEIRDQDMTTDLTNDVDGNGVSISISPHNCFPASSKPPDHKEDITHEPNAE